MPKTVGGAGGQEAPPEKPQILFEETPGYFSHQIPRGGGRSIDSVNPEALRPIGGGPEHLPYLNVMKTVMALEASGYRTRDIFKELSTRFTFQAPYTAYYMATVQPDEAGAASASAGVDWLGEVYQVSAATLTATHLITNPASAEYTRTVLSDIAEMEFGWRPGTSPFATSGPPEDILNELVKDPSQIIAKWKNLPVQDQIATRSLAQELFDSLAQGGTDLAQSLANVQVVLQNGYSTVLDPQAQAGLKTLWEYTQSGNLGTTSEVVAPNDPDLDDSLARGLGFTMPVPQVPGLLDGAIIQIRRQGGGTLVIDEAYARLHPDEALAAKLYLQTLAPEADIQIGPEGLIGSLIDKANTPIDWLTAPIGAGIRQMSEYVERLGRGDDAPAARKFAQYILDTVTGDTVPDDIKTALPSATLESVSGDLVHIPTTDGGVWEFFGDNTNPDDVRQFALHLMEDNTDEVGWQQFQDQMAQGMSPRAVGFGFADNMTKAMDILPGDPNYGVAYAAIGLLAQTLAEPLNMGLPWIGGIKDANRFAKLHGVIDPVTGAVDMTRDFLPVVSRSWIHQKQFERLARYPEELILTPGFKSARAKLWATKVNAGSDARFLDILVEDGKDLEAARRLVRTATSEEALGIGMISDMVGMGRSEDVLNTTFHLDNQLEAIDDELKAMRSDIPLTHAENLRRTDLMAQQLQLEDILRGSDSIQPMQGIMGGRQLKRLNKAAKIEPGVYENFGEAAADSVHRIPFTRRLTRDRAALQAEYDIGREAGKNVDNVKAANRTFIRGRHMTQQTGAGESIIFEYTGEASAASGLEQAQKKVLTAEAVITRQQDAAKAGGTLATFKPSRAAIKDLKLAQAEAATREVMLTLGPNNSVKAMRNIGRFLGHDAEFMRPILRPYVDGSLVNNSKKAWEWLNSSWRKMIDESPVLDGLGKTDLRDLVKTLQKDRAGGRIAYLNQSGNWATRSVLHQTYEGLESSPMPSISADMVRGVQLPSLDHLRSYMTINGRSMRQFAKANGWAKKFISRVDLGIAAAWTGTNSVWRSWVLGTRLLGALPLRIIGEQQLRMAGFDYASMVWHPMEWYAHTAKGVMQMGSEAYAEWAALSPVGALGSVTDFGVADRGYALARETSLASEGLMGSDPMFYRAHSSRLQKFVMSPEVYRYRFANGEIKSPQQMEVLLNAMPDDLKAMWLSHFDQSDGTLQENLQALHTELTQLVGDDPQDIMKTALRMGRVEYDGDLYIVGTDRFADLLGRLHKEGSWTPGMDAIPTKWGSYLPGDRVYTSNLVSNWVQNFKNRLFKWGYTGPDLATSRKPLHLQIADRHYGNLIGIGYEPATAQRVARAVAADETADMMFTIGAHSSGEKAMVHISPFFPAYRELAATWLIRVPSRIGQMRDTRMAALGWGLGLTELGLRARRYKDFMLNMGYIHQDPAGKLYFNVPGIGSIVSLVTGADVPFFARGSVASLAGIVPMPSNLGGEDEQGNPLPLWEQLRGTLPTIGGAATPILGLLEDRFPEIFTPVSNWVTMFGTDQSFAPTAVDRVFEALGLQEWQVWLGGSRRTHQALQAGSVVDGIRIAHSKSPRPAFDPKDPDYIKNWTAWRDELVAAGERYSHNLYLFKALTAAMLPFAINVEDETKAQMSEIWTLISALPEGGGGKKEVTSKVWETFLATYPDLQAYMTRKTIDRRHFDAPLDDIRAFFAAVNEGKIIPRTPRDWAAFNYMMYEYSLHNAEMAQIRENSGATIAEQMSNPEARAALVKERLHWDSFMIWMDNNAGELGYDQSPSDMFRRFNEIKALQAEDKTRLTLEQERIVSFQRLMGEFATFWTVNPDKSADYYKLVQEAYKAIHYSGPKSDYVLATAWYFGKFEKAYYSKLNKLYGELELAKDQAPVFLKIQQLSNRYNKEWVKEGHPEWGVFPSPEAYSFTMMSPADQRDKLTGWAVLPGIYLTQFQREQVYGQQPGTPQAKEQLEAFAATERERLAAFERQNDVSTSAHEANLAEYQRKVDQRAIDLGVSAYGIPDSKQFEMNKYAYYASKELSRLNEFEDENKVSVYSTAHDDNMAEYGAKLRAKAKQLGVTAQVQVFETPAYERVNRALGISAATPNWDNVVAHVRQVKGVLAGQKDSPSAAGQTPAAQAQREKFADYVEKLRRTDDKLDGYLDEIAAAIGETNHYDFYDKFFFDVFI